MTAQQHWKRSGIVEDLNATIRDNPLAAGLIGAGALWMLLGNRGVMATAAGIGAAASGTGAVAAKAGSAAYDSARSAAQAVGSAGASVAATLKSAGSHGIDKVASIVPDISANDASDYGFTAEQARARTSSPSTSSTGHYAAKMKSTLADTFERQPLLLGAVGLAIGVAIASSFRTTAMESQWIGQQGAEAREKLKQAAKDATGRAWEAGKEEAQKQNLTEDAGWDAAERLAEKAQNVFKAGRDSLQGAASGATGSQTVTSSSR